MITYLYIKQHRKTGLKYFGKTTNKNPKKYPGSGLYWIAHLEKHGYDIETTDLWSFDNPIECEKFATNFSQTHNIVESSEWANLKEENGLDGGFSGYRWYSNGFEDKLSRESPGDNWVLGRLNQKPITKGYRWFNNGKENVSAKEKPAGDEWVEGMLPKNIKSLIDKTHLFFQPEHREMLRQKTLKSLADGTHSSQHQWTCQRCGKSGKGLANFSRWHGDNCRNL